MKEGQEIGEAVLDAEVRIGELMRQVPKASGGDRRSENFKNNTNVTFEKQKKQVISDMGFTPMQVSRFETLAAHPEIVAQAAPPRSRRAHRPTGTASDRHEAL